MHPIGSAIQYPYVGNDPVNWTDPSGDSAQGASAASAPISVGYKQVYLNQGNCFGVQAELDTLWTGIPCSQGFLIQKVDKTRSAWGCFGNKMDSVNVTFYEAASVSCVNKNPIISTSCGNINGDTFHFHIFGQFGSESDVGHGMFYPGSALPHSATGWHPGSYISYANDCTPVTYGPVANWPSGPPKVLDETWDCCDCPTWLTGSYTP